MSRISDCISELQKLLDISFSAATLSDHAGSHYQTIADVPLDSFTDLIKEAIMLLMSKESTIIPFSQRRLLEQKCDEWIRKNGALPCTFSVITFLASRGMLKLDDVYRVIGEDLIYADTDSMEVSCDDKDH